ncbi:MAG: shikimate kinase [Lachnospiraceae bacterium]|nr:shikimate kinase [Lachnospiraceae bacterium]
MGSGKSSVGKEIAQSTNSLFLDTDAWIEEKEQMTISDIFASKGEVYFRDIETKCLKELLKEEDIHAFENKKVISVGGGLPLREENRTLLSKLGNVIYLKASPDTIYNRLKGDTSRPLLQGENPKKKIMDMMAVREEKYQDAADLVIDVDEKTITEIVEEINWGRE